jgi:hypothetical protein
MVSNGPTASSLKNRFKEKRIRLRYVSRTNIVMSAHGSIMVLPKLVGGVIIVSAKIAMLVMSQTVQEVIQIAKYSHQNLSLNSYGTRKICLQSLKTNRIE